MKNLAIVGMHPRTREQVDWDDQNLNIWGFNEVISKPGYFKRADAIFQMHVPAIWKNPKNRNDPNHYEWLRTQTAIPIYMLDNYPEVPACVKYPMDEIVADLLPSLTVDSEKKRKTFFTATAAFALALAIYQGYRKIDLYGIELETANEYAYQRDSTCFWMGVALGRGIDLTIHSRMLDTPIYGLESFIPLGKNTFTDTIASRTPQAENARGDLEEIKAKAAGLFKRFEQQDSVRTELEQVIGEHNKVAQTYGRLEGARQEAERFLKRAETMETASGEYTFSKHEFERDFNARGKERDKTIMEWQQVAGKCQQLLSQIGLPYDSRRRKLYKELGNLLDGYINMSLQIGFQSGAMEEDAKYRKMMEATDNDTTG